MLRFHIVIGPSQRVAVAVLREGGHCIPTRVPLRRTELPHLALTASLLGTVAGGVKAADSILVPL